MTAIAFNSEEIIIDDVRVPISVAKAAPEMLGALRKMVAYFESDIEGFDEDDPKYVAFQQARAAIGDL